MIMNVNFVNDRVFGVKHEHFYSYFYLLSHTTPRQIFKFWINLYYLNKIIDNNLLLWRHNYYNNTYLLQSSLDNSNFKGGKN